MAKANLSPMIKEIHGRIGGIVFYMRKHVIYIRRYVRGTNPDTEAQRAVRGTFGDAVREWQAMTCEEKYRFTRKARNLNMSGYNLFISGYMKSKIYNVIDQGLKTKIPELHSRLPEKSSYQFRITSVSASLRALYGRNMPCFSIPGRNGPFAFDAPAVFLAAQDSESCSDIFNPVHPLIPRSLRPA